MPEEPLNPYAPPSEGGQPDGGRSAPGYRVEGEWLVVRHGTQLPEVDLDGREEGAALTPVGLRFATGGSLPAARLVLAGPLVALGLWIVGLEPRVLLPVLVPVMLGLGLGLVLLRRKGPTGVWKVSGYASRKALRRRWRRMRLRSSASLLLLLLLLLPWLGRALLPPGAEIRLPIGSASLLAPVALAFVALMGWQLLDAGWSCAKVADGWLYLRGIRPEALSALGARTGELPGSRVRRVQVFRLHRLPLTRLVTALRWNPLQWLLVARLKLFRSRALERPVFHWSETEWGGPEAADPGLRAWWERRVAGTLLEDWQAVAVTRTDAPEGDTRTVEIVYLAPDRRAVMVPGLVRFANGKAYVERHQLHARSWTVDGRVLATGTLPLRRWVPDWLEAVAVKGPPRKVAARHLRRLVGEDVRPIGPAEVRERCEREMAARTAAMEAAGVLGPVEEVTLPG